MSMKSATSLGERLWNLLKDESFTYDIVLLKCSDSKECRAHKTVLIASSGYFLKCLTQDPAPQSLDVPYCSEVINLVIEFLYLGTPVKFNGKHAIQLYCAAKEFALEDLGAQIPTSLNQLLYDTDFLHDDSYEHVRQMKDIFETTIRDKLVLVTRLLRWGRSKEVKPEDVIDLLCSVTASIDIQSEEKKENSSEPINPPAFISFGSVGGPSFSFSAAGK